PRRGDVRLDDDEVRPPERRQVEPLDVLVVQRDVVAAVQVAGERGEPEGREQRVLDRPEERAGGFGQSGEDHHDAHASTLGTRPRTPDGGDVEIWWRSPVSG